VTRAPLFAALDGEAVAALRASMTELTFVPGQVLLRQGDPGNHLHVIAEGEVKPARATGHRQESLLAVLAPGEMFGELSLFDPGPRISTATAFTEARLLALNHDDLKRWLQDRPQVAIRLLTQLARRLRRTPHLAADLVFCDVPARLANTLLDLSQRFGAVTTDGLHVGHDLTPLDLAGLLGASRQTINRSSPTSPNATGCAWNHAPSPPSTPTNYAAAPIATALPHGQPNQIGPAPRAAARARSRSTRASPTARHAASDARRA
jgi:CRP-like cAMP-binding protein